MAPVLLPRRHEPRPRSRPPVSRGGALCRRPPQQEGQLTWPRPVTAHCPDESGALLAVVGLVVAALAAVVVAQVVESLFVAIVTVGSVLGAAWRRPLCVPHAPGPVERRRTARSRAAPRGRMGHPGSGRTGRLSAARPGDRGAGAAAARGGAGAGANAARDRASGSGGVTGSCGTSSAGDPSASAACHTKVPASQPGRPRTRSGRQLVASPDATPPASISLQDGQIVQLSADRRQLQGDLDCPSAPDRPAPRKASVHAAAHLLAAAHGPPAHSAAPTPGLLHVSRHRLALGVQSRDPDSTSVSPPQRGERGVGRPPYLYRVVTQGGSAWAL